MQIIIPERFFSIPYNGKRYPINKGIDGNLDQGANCQLFVYVLLKYFGLPLKKYFRSAELWKDIICTEKVSKLQPLDIVFFNKSINAYGAHLGLYIGNNKIIHLPRNIGYPVIWDLKEFKKNKKYRIMLGGKRVKK